MQKETVGFALCGSFCTFKKVIPQIKKLVNEGYKTRDGWLPNERLWSINIWDYLF